MNGQFVTFLSVAVLLTITPGADMALVTRQAIGYGRAAAIWTTYGIVTGLVVWAVLAIAGLAALLAASATAFAVLKLLGGAYLVWLGVQAVWSTRGQPADHAAPRPQPRSPGPTVRHAYRQGLLSNLLNPKVGIFYTTFLPQFVAPGDPLVPWMAAFAAIHILMGGVWLTCYVRLVVRAGDVLRRPAVRRWLERVTGTVLMALGLRLATTVR